MKKRHEQKLVIVALALYFVFNIPFVLIFNINGAILGIPVLYFFIFTTWLLSIIVSFIILKRFYE